MKRLPTRLLLLTRLLAALGLVFQIFPNGRLGPPVPRDPTSPIDFHFDTRGLGEFGGGDRLRWFDFLCTQAFARLRPKEDFDEWFLPFNPAARFPRLPLSLSLHPNAGGGGLWFFFGGLRLGGG